jgi:hypothetical protein
MALYLIVAHQTAASPELVERVRALADRDPEARFALLVPATPHAHLLQTWDETEVREIARRQARAAMDALAAVGVELVSARIGDPAPLLAIDDELREHPGYTGIVLSTFPPGVSRWLRGDLPSRLRRRLTIPVEHVVAQPAPAPTTA